MTNLLSLCPCVGCFAYVPAVIAYCQLIWMHQVIFFEVPSLEPSKHLAISVGQDHSDDDEGVEGLLALENSGAQGKLLSEVDAAVIKLEKANLKKKWVALSEF